MQWRKNTDTERFIETEIKSASIEPVSDLPTKLGNNSSMSVPRKKLIRCIKAAIVISLLSSVIVVVRVHYFKQENSFSFPFFSSLSMMYSIGHTVKINLDDKTLILKNTFSDKTLKVTFIGDTIGIDTKPDLDSCAKIFRAPDTLTVTDSHNIRSAGKDGNSELKFVPDPYTNAKCFKWNHTILMINITQSTSSQCYSVHWETADESSTPQNCFSLSHAHWYGGSLLTNQQWPLEDNSFTMQPYISSQLDIFHSRTAQAGSFGPVLERVWFSSAGFAVIADGDEPLHVSLNDKIKEQLCLKSQYKDSLYVNTSRRLSLKYAVCVDRTAPLVHQTIIRDFIQLPKSGPDGYLLENPVWSTRGINMKNLTQAQVLTKQIEINKKLFLHSQLHIGGNYTRTVGSIYFDHNRFPNSHQMISEINSLGFNVSTSILPFVERGPYPFEFDDGFKAGIFVSVSRKKNQSQGGNIPSLEWDGRTVGLVDFTNPRAVEWMTKRVQDLKTDAPVHSFHFDSGDASLLSKPRSTYVPLQNPCYYSMHYVKFAHSMGTDSIVNVGYRSQQYGLMVDIGARSSTWGYDLGLQSIIPSVLTAGLMGYPFVLVGPVGGVPVGKFDFNRNQYGLPDEGLYVRWLQLATFLPGIEISVGPWQYKNNKLETMAHELFKRRTEEILPIFQTIIKEFLRTGAPLIRPLWWMAADDEVAQRIDCEFLVGDELLVAPVFEPGATQRSVYLPKVKGLMWHDNLRGDLYEGGQWRNGYKVDLYEVATFSPVRESNGKD